jgi:hypothetical protein
MIRHVVMIKFKKDAKQEDIDTFITEVKKLSHLNKEIRDYSHGLCVKEPRFHSGDFDFANCCDIDSYDAMERYMSHWAHIRMTPFLPDILENMISFDWEIDYHGPEFDEAAAREEAEKEKARVIPPHNNPEMAYVPELRGTSIATAKARLAQVGLELGNVEEILGSVWAPDRIMVTEPEFGQEVKKGTKVSVSVTGDWLCGPQTVDVAAAW